MKYLTERSYKVKCVTDWTVMDYVLNYCVKQPRNSEFLLQSANFITYALAIEHPHISVSALTFQRTHIGRTTTGTVTVVNLFRSLSDFY